MSTQPPAQRYSPDGRFWWDGTGWRPVDAAPPAPALGQPVPAPGQPGPAQFQPPLGTTGQPPAGPAAPPGTARPPGAPGPGFPPPPGAIPRRPSKAGFVLALVGTLVVAAVLGGLAGGVTGLVTTEPPGSDDPPPLAAEFPNGERQYMTKVTLAVVVEDWMKKANSWKCTDKPADPDIYSQARKVTECSPPDDEYGDMVVTVEYDAEDKIRVVSSSCDLGLKTNACTTLASTLAGAVLSLQGDRLRKQAEKWAKENADSERVTTIGGIQLEASLSPHGMTATPSA